MTVSEEGYATLMRNNRMRSLIFIIALQLLLACRMGTAPPVVTGPPICNAQHSWENYHLPDWALERPIQVLNTSSYEADLEAWNTLAGNPVTLTVDSGSGFTIEIRDGGDASSGWLGLASVWANSEGHISKGVVTMNMTVLAQYDSNVAAHVLAQEIGHILGLGHQRNADDSAMDDCQGRGAGWLRCLSSVEGMTPNPHDGEQLAEVYRHATGAPPPGCSAGTEFQIVLHSFSASDLGGDHVHS